jgi:TonB-dependent SusC/RagA subfamily outer membrane receptor
MKKFYTLVVLALFSLAAGSLSAQTVKGRVTGPDKTGLPGVVVKDQISGMGAATDIDGNFNINLAVGAHKIEFILLGFETQVKDVNLTAGQTLDLSLQMVEDLSLTEEVVVVGYGVQRKREVTGSISKIDGKELTRLPVPSFEAALQGQAAGVQVTQGSGMAGSGSLLRIRGIASVSAGGDPLYVVDGIPITQNNFLNGNSGAMNNNPLASINPNDIESVEILKDAAATGIYGSRGANGVVLITTKRGKGKGFGVDYTTRFGISTPATLPNMLNTEQYLAIRQEAWENDGGTGYVWLPGFSLVGDDASTRETAFKQAQKTNTDWVDLTTGVGFKMMHSASITHSGTKHNLYAGLTYDDNGSYLIGNTYKRLSGRINLDYQIQKI